MGWNIRAAKAIIVFLTSVLSVQSQGDIQFDYPFFTWAPKVPFFPSGNPLEDPLFFHWQNPRLLRQRERTNDRNEWDGRPVVVFVHGIRSSTLTTFDYKPNVDADGLGKGLLACKNLLVSLASGNCKGSQIVKQMNYIRRISDFWPPLIDRPISLREWANNRDA
jgi:hypothetical protein